MLHALGPGLLIAEIQQASDITYRLFDWNRLGPGGVPRTLHVEQALEAIDYDYGPVSAQQPQSTQRPHVERLVECDKFLLDRWTFSDSQSAGGDDRCHILMVLDGAVEVTGDPAGGPLTRGGVVLLPAQLGPVTLHAERPSVILDAYLP